MPKKSTSPPSSPSSAGSSSKPKKPDPAVRKTRSKTGCLTCRRRRVKCDEARPTCMNCIKAGRKCDYNMRLSFRSGLSSKLMQQIGKTEVGEQVMDFSDTDTLRFASQDNSSSGGGPSSSTQQPPLYVNFPVKEESREGGFDSSTSTIADGKAVKKEDLEHEWRIEVGGGDPVEGSGRRIEEISPQMSPQLSSPQGPLQPQPQGPLQPPQHQPQPQLVPSQQPPPAPPPQQLQQPIIFEPYEPDYNQPKTVVDVETAAEQQVPPAQRGISLYVPSATESPLSNPIAIFLLREYVYKHGQGISCYDRYNVSPASIFDNVNHHSLRGMSNFWTFDVPLAALTCDFLLHAVLAWSALNHSMFTPDEDSQYYLLGMEHYHTSIQLLSSEIRMGTYKHNPMPAAATCLILAFFETYCGDLGNWFRHMTGAHEIIRETTLSELSHIGQEGSVFGLQQLELLYSYLRMDIMHSIVGGTGTFAPWQFWASVPSRVASNPAVYANDEILKVFAQICFYIEEENVRKRGGTIQQTNERFNESLLKWKELKEIVAQFRVRFSTLLAPLPPRGPPELSPFGPKTVRASTHHDLVAAFLGTAEILLHRIDPNVPVMGFAAIPFTAKACIEPMLEVIRSLPVSPKSFMMSDIYTTDQTGVSLSHGEKLQILCSFTVPFFLAAVQVMDPSQQEFVASWYEDMFQSTGFKTALIIKNSLLRGWSDARKRMAGRSASASPASASESPESVVSPESSTSSVADGKPRIRMDNGTLVGYDGKPVDSVSDPANRVRFAHGVLGDTTEMMQKLKLSESESDGQSPLS